MRLKEEDETLPWKEVQHYALFKKDEDKQLDEYTARSGMIDYYMASMWS